jgi:hypothetical protein
MSIGLSDFLPIPAQGLPAATLEGSPAVFLAGLSAISMAGCFRYIPCFTTVQRLAKGGSQRSTICRSAPLNKKSSTHSPSRWSFLQKVFAIL